jgi:hypothetical protein
MNQLSWNIVKHEHMKIEVPERIRIKDYATTALKTNKRVKWIQNDSSVEISLIIIKFFSPRKSRGKFHSKLAPISKFI